jgi:hypothetical protein
MIPFKIGNWLITKEGIEWDGQPEIDYLIAKDTLLQLRKEEHDKKHYDWLLHIPLKTWTTKEDIYAFNTAFIYAIECFGLDFNKASFVTTLISQEITLNKKKV